MKTKFLNQVERHSPCLELCMDHAFGSCTKTHDSSSDGVGIYEVASSVKDLLSNLNPGEQRKLTVELDSLLSVQKQYKPFVTHKAPVGILQIHFKQSSAW